MATAGLHLLRVLLVDDQKLIRYSVRLVCQALPQLDIVGEAENGQQAVELASRLSPDLVLMDVQMPVLDGLEAGKQILEHYPNIAIIFLSAHYENGLVRQALQIGARGYMQKNEFTEERLTHAVRVIEAGGLFFDIRTGTGWLQSLASV